MFHITFDQLFQSPDKRQANLPCKVVAYNSIQPQFNRKVWNSLKILYVCPFNRFVKSIVKGNVILLTRAPDLRQAQNTSNIEDIKIWVDKDGINPTDDLKQILNELDLKDKSIGIEYEAYGMTGRNALRLNETLKNYCNLNDESELITKLRVIKSQEEIVYVKKAAELADNALDQAWKYCKAGVNEAKILAEMQKIVLEGGGDYPANEYIIGSGHNALLCRYQAEKRNLSNQDQLSIEWAGTYKHYHSAMFRTILLGKTDPKHIKMHEACVQALKNC